MNRHDTIAVEKAFENVTASFAQVALIQRMIDDCHRHIQDNPESFKIIQRDFIRLWNEWNLVFTDFMTMKAEFTDLMAAYLDNLQAFTSGDLSGNRPPDIHQNAVP